MPAISAGVRETIRFSRSSCGLLPITATNRADTQHPINRRSNGHQPRSDLDGPHVRILLADDLGRLLCTHTSRQRISFMAFAPTSSEQSPDPAR